MGKSGIVTSANPLRWLPAQKLSGLDFSSSHKLLPYVLAVVVSAIALYLRHVLVPFLGETDPYLTTWLAVVFCSWYCGLGPSLLASMLCLVGVDYFFLEPVHSLLIRSVSERYGMFWFFIFSAVIVVFGESNRRAARFRKIAEDQLKAANDQLECRVEERTTDLQRKNRLLLEQTDMVRQLSARLLQLRDEERRRIARELHDSVGQLLAAIRMNWSKVAKEKGSLTREAAKSVDDNAELLNQTLAEVRTMSHLLHPPLLDEIGLESAIRCFAEGFAQRSTIQVNLAISPGLGRLADELELAIFRIVQECLTNVHRHSESKTATVHLVKTDGYIHCEINDEGKGIGPERQAALNATGPVGVGLRGMRERVRQLGGILEVRSNGKGTSVEAILPVRHIEPAALDVTKDLRQL
jgi:signal transduction histidine kinase